MQVARGNSMLMDTFHMFREQQETLRKGKEKTCSIQRQTTSRKTAQSSQLHVLHTACQVRQCMVTWLQLVPLLKSDQLFHTTNAKQLGKTISDIVVVNYIRDIMICFHAHYTSPVKIHNLYNEPPSQTNPRLLQLFSCLLTIASVSR